MKDECDNQLGILRIAKVSKKTGLSKNTIYRLMNCGLFPSSIKLSCRSVGWIESEIDVWAASRQRMSCRSSHHRVGDCFDGGVK